MKKLHASALFGAAISMAAAPIFGALNASAASTYYDYSELSGNLNGDYSYTKIYYTNNTKITAKKSSVAEDVGRVIVSGGRVVVDSGATYGDANNPVTLLVEDSTAKTPNGTPVDVIYKITDINAWADDASMNLDVAPSIMGSSKESHPATADEETQTRNLGPGDPIAVWINSSRADGNFSIKFCQKGTYNSANNDCIAATGMGKVSMMAWDFDVPNNSKNNEDVDSRLWMDKPFNGDESIFQISGNPKIYYNKETSIDGVTMVAANGGVSVSASNGASFNGIYWANSAMVVADTANATFSFRYSGMGCGINTFFGSAIPYAMPNPTKTVNKSTAKVGEALTYSISQFVPNNYTSEADIIAFSSLWSNYARINRTKNYTAFSINDTFDTSLTVPAANTIKVRNESGTDVTSMFNVSVSGQKVTITAKTDTLSAEAFYGHTFTVTINTTVKTSASKSPIPNSAATDYTPDGGTPVNLPSEPVQTVIQRQVTVIHIDDETEEEIAESEDKGYFNPGQSYTSDPSDDIPEHYVLVETPGNASGTVDNKDITIIYRYTPPRTVTVTHIDEQTGEEIAESSSEEYAKGDDYETEPSKDIPAGYVLVETPGNASGTVDDDVEVTYVYRKIKNPKTNDDSFGFMAAVTGATLVGAALVFTLMRRR